MSGIELAGISGISIGLIDLSISALQAYQSILTDNIRDYGYTRGFALETVFFQARNVVGRIRRHVLGSFGNGAKEAWSVKESYATSFNMIAVAGAIVAQIAITALSLEYLEATHWTATAAFVVSLVAGLLSVYFACILQQQLSGLHDPDEVKRWLTMVQRKRKRLFRDKSEIEIAPSPRQAYDEYVMPSYNAALLLVLPSILLNWSSIALLIGIGIYYGIVHTENLSSVRGENSSLAILLVYVLFTLGASASYMLPWLQKQLESTAPVQQALQQLYRDEPRTPPPPPHFVSRAEPHDSYDADCTGQSVRFDLLRTGGVRDLGRPASGQDELPTTSRTLRPPSSGPEHDPGANGNHQHDPSLPTTFRYAPVVTPAFVAALDASIAAQTASLRAHELLRSELRERPIDAHSQEGAVSEEQSESV